EDLVSHLRTSDARYCASLPAEFLAKNPPPMYITLYFIVTRLPDSLRAVKDQFLALDPTALTVDLLKQHLLAAETSVVAVGAARGTPRTPFSEGCSPTPLAPFYASAAGVDVLGAEDVGAASASAKRCSSKGKGGRGGGGGSGGGGGGSSGGGGGGCGGGSGGGSGGFGGSGGGGDGGRGGSGSGGGRTGAAQQRGSSGGQRQQQQRRSETSSPQQLCEWFSQRGTSRDDAWRTEFGDEAELPRWAELLRTLVAIFDLDIDAILATIYALSVSAEGDSYLCVSPDPSIEAAALGASESALPGTVLAEALHTFTLDSGASRCFFRDSTTLTPLSARVPLRMADPSGVPVLATSSTLLPCPAIPSSSLSGLHLPSFSTNLVSTTALQNAMVTNTTPGGVQIRSGSTPLLVSPPVAPDSPLAPPPWSPLPARLCGMHSRLLVSGLPRSLPPLPPSPAPPCLPRVEGQQRAAPHSSFPPTIAPVQTLHMDMWGPACPRVSLPETSPTLRWMGKVGDASVFRVWGSRAFVRDTSVDKLSTRAIPCIFLGFPPDAPSWQFYHPTLRCVFPSQDVTFDESVPFYRLFPYRSAPCPPPPLFLAPGAAQGAASGGAASGGAEPRGAEPGGAKSEIAGSRGAKPEGVERGGDESGGAEPRGTASSGGPAGASPQLSPWAEPLSPQQLREWFPQRTRLQSGGAAAAGPGGARTRGTGAAVTGGVGGAEARDPTEPRAGGAGGAGAGGTGAGGTGAGGVGAGGTGTGGARTGGGGAVDPRAGGAGGTVRPRPYFFPLLQQVLGVPSSTGLPPPLLFPPPDQTQPPLQPASPLHAPSPYTEQIGGLTKSHAPASCPASPVQTGRRVPHPRPPPIPGTHAMALCPSFVTVRVPLPAPRDSSLPAVPDPESDRARAARPTVSCLLATTVTDPSFESTAASTLVAELLDIAAACRLDYATALVARSESASPPSIGGECALGTDVFQDRQEDFECLAAAVPCFASMMLAPEGDLDAPDIPTPRSYAEAITCPSSSQWQAAMDAEMASWKSTGTYVDAVPPPGVNIIDGIVTTSYTLWTSAQLSCRGSLHEEIWLRRPPGFTGSFPARTQRSLRWPVYGLRQAPQEWHDTLRTTLAALGFTPSTADPSLFLHTDTSLLPFYVVMYIDDLVFTTADTEAVTLVKSKLQKRHTCTDLGELRSYLGLQITRDRAQCTITLTQTHMVHQVLQRFCFQFSLPQPTPLSAGHSLSAPPSDESVEPSGPYLELVGCLMYLMTCTRPDLTYPLSLMARYVAPGRHRKRSSLGYTFSLGSGSLSWRSTRSSSVLSSSCEAEIYAGAMAAQELRWLTYLLTDLGEQPRSPPVLYVDTKAMIALCQEHRLEHRTKHIALRYFLARGLQQRGQLHLAYVATRANTADIFTKALTPGDHQRFSTLLLCFS
ncbi:unnamed protein product, partial [Closterium sp. NIES-53]